MSQLTIGIVGRGKNPHAACFEDYAFALRDALKALGHELRPETNPGRYLMLGSNNLASDKAHPIPPDAIVINTEQLAAVDDPKSIMTSWEQYREHVVWDYSEANIKVLRALGFKRIVHVPLGYIKSMTSISMHEESEDIDVLFYGSTNGRRLEILSALDAAKLKVCRLFGVYGHDRDKYIARAKVVLNLHFYEGAVFEIFRVSHLLANAKAVITEGGGCDPALEDLASRTCLYIAPESHDGQAVSERIVKACRYLCREQEARVDYEQRGFTAFSQLDFVESVRRGLKES